MRCDQKGESIYGRLVQTGRTGVANVEDKANETFSSLFGDFATAVYTDSLPGIERSRVPARLRLTSRNLRQIFKRLTGIAVEHYGRDLITDAQVMVAAAPQTNRHFE